MSGAAPMQGMRRVRNALQCTCPADVDVAVFIHQAAVTLPHQAVKRKERYKRSKDASLLPIDRTVCVTGCLHQTAAAAAPGGQAQGAL